MRRHSVDCKSAEIAHHLPLTTVQNHQENYNCFKIFPFKFFGICLENIDDIFMICTQGEEHLKSFVGYLNSIHPGIKFTHKYYSSLHKALPFLDVQVHLFNNHLQANLHTKPTDKHQYLLRTSCRPNYTKKKHPIEPLTPNPPHMFYRHFL